jgi:hypothetical protein
MTKSDKKKGTKRSDSRGLTKNVLIVLIPLLSAPANPKFAEAIDIIDIPSRREGIHVIPLPRKKDT